MEHGWRGTSGWGFLRGVENLHGPGSWLVKNWLFSKNGPPGGWLFRAIFLGGDEIELLPSYGGIMNYKAMTL